MTQSPPPPPSLPVGPPLDSARHAVPVPVPSRPALPPAESWLERAPRSARRATDRFAVAGFVLSLPGVAPVAVVLALVGLRRIRRSGAPGRRLAHAGLAISACWIIALVLAAALGAYGERRAGIGRTVAVADVRVGQCFDADLNGGTLRVVRIADCAAPHGGEAYARVGAALSGLSGEAEDTAATGQCADGFDEFVGKAYEDSVLDVYYVVLAEKPVADGNILCMLGRPGHGMTGSMRGSGR